MGDYNPSAPYIIGNEYVPIRNEPMQFAPALNFLEQGAGFTLQTGATIQDVRFYINDWPQSTAPGQVWQAAIYPRGAEELSGPIKRVVIPVTSVTTTGAGAQLVNVSAPFTAAHALADPSDDGLITLVYQGAIGALDAYFDTLSYAQQLNGKRIVAVNVLYSLAGNIAFLNEQAATTGSPYGIEAGLKSLNNSSQITYGMTYFNTLTCDPWSGLKGSYPAYLTPGPRNVYRMELGEINPFWKSLYTTNDATRHPFTYSGLSRMDFTNTGAGNGRFSVNWYGRGMGLTTDATNYLNVSIGLHYLALEVLYCDENRLGVGARSFGWTTNSQGVAQYVYGQNAIPMQTLDLAALVLPPADYSVMLSSANVGGLTLQQISTVASGSYPPLNANRMYKTVSPHPIIRINTPYPMDETAVGKTFERVTSVINPQLSVHTSGGPIVNVNSYGEVNGAPIYGSITASQDIQDGSSSFPLMPSGAVPWPQVRFYARRFGDTSVPLKLDSTTVTGSSVQITPAEFDALDTELIDGWKEVTLRFTSPPSMGNLTGDQVWRWSATGEASANRWEILAVTAPAVSGYPGTLLNQAPAIHRLGPTTYGAPTDGSGTNLMWMSPTVSGVGDDPATDAVLIFSQDPPTVTGHGLTMQTQSLSLVDPTCGNARCTPTGIYYHQITWPGLTETVYDTFDRTVSSGWGTPNVGNAWTTSGGSASDYAVSGGVGTHSHSAVNTRHFTLGSNNFSNAEVFFTVSVPAVATGANLEAAAVLRRADANNFYVVGIKQNTSGTINVIIRRTTAGVTTTLVDSLVSGQTYDAGTKLSVRASVARDIISVRVWRDTAPEPDWWHGSVVDSAPLTAVGSAGLTTLVATSNTNTLPFIFTFYDFTVTPTYFKAYELQRVDTIDTDWQTIMLSTSPSTLVFNDYEARVGIVSRYRIRVINTSDFAGPWSSELSGTITSPGVTSTGSPSGVFIFTTNEVQSGASNLAYVETWTGAIEEKFLFPESRNVEYRTLMGRDYQVAFRPTERLGENFSRVMLVQAAAVSELALERSFKSLRDLAWSDVNYICVRDEIGSRWLADIIVPQGVVQRNRRLRLVSIDITEVTATPTPVDLGA